MTILRIAEYFNGSLWAMKSDTLETVASIIQTKIAGNDVSDIKLYDIKENRDFSFGKEENKTAVIPIYGTLLPRGGAFSSSRTYRSIEQDVQTALEDETVSSILLDIDSPGGAVAGIHQLISFLREAKQQKPIYAFTDGSMSSAAYFIASTANKVFASPLAHVGSIGVIATHVDASKFYEDRGLKITFITGGEYKALGNDAEPLGEKGKEYLTGLINASYESFRNQVAEFRALDSGDYKKWAEGRVFSPKDAKKAGLIDDIMGFGEVLAFIDSSQQNADNFIGARGASSMVEGKAKDHKEVSMPFDPKQFADDGAFQKFVEDTKAGVKAEFSAELAKKDGQVVELSEKLTKMSDSLTQIQAKMEKEEALRQEMALKAEADSVFDAAFSNSSVPDRLKSKVRKQISHHSFVKDGVLGKEEFQAAIEAELNDWKDISDTKASVQGFGTSQREVAETDSGEKKFEDLAVHMASLIGISTENKQ